MDLTYLLVLIIMCTFRNPTVKGNKGRCMYCGSFGHIGEKDCMKQSDLVREFLRIKIGVDKLRPSAFKKGKFEDFSHIARSKTVFRETLTVAEKEEQKSAEQKLKDRLKAKFGIKDPKETSSSPKPASPKPYTASVHIFEEEAEEGDYSYDEPDPSVFDGKDLRTDMKVRLR